ncbi:MAG: tRNA adenosine deaminase-associated protein [Actinomycetota bacterium]|nr:tRNA adenosine deaminase-associated protein [Actinomycetota bacterium]
MAENDVDFAIAAYRDEGVWQLAELHASIAEDIDDLLSALKRFPSDVGVLAFVSVNDEFFVIARALGSKVRLLLSDVTAVTDWPLANGVADILDVPDPEDDDEPQPAGDLDIVSDLGMQAMELGVLCDDPDLYPDEVLSDIARRLGFGDDFEALVG